MQEAETVCYQGKRDHMGAPVLQSCRIFTAILLQPRGTSRPGIALTRGLVCTALSTCSWKHM